MSVPEGAGALADVRGVVAVVAHPDDESFGLGAVLGALVLRGARAAVVCLTRGEASTLRGPEDDGVDLAAVRTAELRAAARVLGVSRVEQLGYPDGGLEMVPAAELAGHVRHAVDTEQPTHLLVFDDNGVTSHADHVQATRAALVVAAERCLPVLAWTIPATVANGLNTELGSAFVGRDPSEIDLELSVDRSLQRRACAQHRSQETANAVLHRRLEMCGRTETLRWLTPPRPRPAQLQRARGRP